MSIQVNHVQFGHLLNNVKGHTHKAETSDIDVSDVKANESVQTPATEQSNDFSTLALAAKYAFGEHVSGLIAEGNTVGFSLGSLPVVRNLTAKAQVKKAIKRSLSFLETGSTRTLFVAFNTRNRKQAEDLSFVLNQSIKDYNRFLKEADPTLTPSVSVRPLPNNQTLVYWAAEKTDVKAEEKELIPAHILARQAHYEKELAEKGELN